MNVLPKILLLTFSLLLTTVAANAQCVRFDSIDSCPIGDATLNLRPDGTRLVVGNLGPDGNDGVAAILDNAVSWQGKIRNVGLTAGDHFTMTSVADGFDTSGMRYTVAANGGLDINVRFTGAIGPGSYTLWLLDDDDDDDSDPEPPRGGPGGLVPGTNIHIELVDPLEEREIEDEVETGFDVGDDEFPAALRSAVSSRTATGYRSCAFSTSFMGRVRVWVDGALIGDADQVVFLEDADAPGHYNYTEFGEMHIESSGKAIGIQTQTYVSNGL